MKITSIRIRVLKNTGNKMVGLVSITLENMIAIHDIKILKNLEGLFLAMPSRSTKAGTFKDSVHPINALVREAIERIIFEAYNHCLVNGYSNSQYDVIAEFNRTLIEQSFSDFRLACSEDNKYSMSDDVSGENVSTSEKVGDKQKKSNAFLEWLNN